METLIFFVCLVAGTIGLGIAGEMLREANLDPIERAIAPCAAYRRAIIALVIGLVAFGYAIHMVVS